MCVNFPQTSLLFRFQSAPRSEERGDTTPHFLEFMGRGVSIRAPLRRAGRSAISGGNVALTLFQSAPRSEERGDHHTMPGSRGFPSFNPRPAPKSGAIWRCLGNFERQYCFNPRPAPKSGAMSNTPALVALSVVSIRAPLRRAGRFFYGQEYGYGGLVSIRAPLRRAGRWAGVDRSRGGSCCFNPRPAPKSGAI